MFFQKKKKKKKEEEEDTIANGDNKLYHVNAYIEYIYFLINKWIIYVPGSFGGYYDWQITRRWICCLASCGMQT